MTHNHNAVWSRADLDKMLQMAEAGHGSASIGLELGRTKAAVSVALCNERKRIRNSGIDAAPAQDPSGGALHLGEVVKKSAVPGGPERISYRIDEAVEMTGIGRTTMYKLVSDGKLRVVRVGGCTLIPADELKALLAPERPNGGFISRFFKWKK
jgi:excisionase family DNA binding protein